MERQRKGTKLLWSVIIGSLAVVYLVSREDKRNHVQAIESWIGNSVACVPRSEVQVGQQNLQTAMASPSKIVAHPPIGWSPPRHRLAVVVRTYPDHLHALPVMMGSLFAACKRAGNVALRLVLVNTDPNSWQDNTFMGNVLQQTQWPLSSCPNSSVEVKTFSEQPWPNAYGYDYTQYALDYLLQDDKSHDYFLFTNGDNLFNADLFKATLPFMDEGNDIIAYDFVTHHHREGIMNTLVKVRFQLSFIDLGAALFSHKAITAARKDGLGTFIPERELTKDMFSRDWRFVEELISRPGVTTAIAPGVLLFHQ